METVAFLGPDRSSVPSALQQYIEQQGGQLKWMPLEAKHDWPQTIILADPIWQAGYYCEAGSIWQSYFAHYHPDCRLLLAGYRPHGHPNYMDLLQLPERWSSFLDTANTADSAPPFPVGEGLSLSDKLRRFLAGHGDDSIIAIFTRLKLTISVVVQEIHAHHTPYEEVYRAFIQPARLPAKWKEWRNRWMFYVPLFSILPFRELLEQLKAPLAILEAWIATECRDTAPLEDHRLTEALDHIQRNLRRIQEVYVGEELSVTDR